MATQNKRKTAEEKAAEVKEELKVEVKEESKTKEPKAKAKTEADEVQGSVVGEFTQQLAIFSKFIYNARNEDVTLVVENLGFGDVYVSDKDNVRVGEESQRVLFKEQRIFNGTQKLFFASASQPVVSIVEVK
ncbi:hypothetical protein SECTIM467_27 [Brevibacillus phage SecTim467]|uniref:Uncharacterized protein n=2 Tax=Jenstvirus jenst TaxID=1982225 RepID=A0A0K2CNX2_9CAUD|nr:hypothetical protein AVV11_gp164 [Brevibacillus phage Jenst]ALA07157.1 hypothetical protein JENST_27 [Brevibacillus phage Jenst]ALA07527.1 hypothetical protein SECTIM467_27 [Brevibacillus phage SecTim467]